jgi:hypothetical protein
MEQRDHIPITDMYTLGPQLFVQPDWKKRNYYSIRADLLKACCGQEKDLPCI